MSSTYASESRELAGTKCLSGQVAHRYSAEAFRRVPETSLRFRPAPRPQRTRYDSAYLLHLGRAEKRTRSVCKPPPEPQALTFLYWYAPLVFFVFSGIRYIRHMRAGAS